MRWPRFRFRGSEDAELDAEIQAHLAMATRERIERGEDPDQAAGAARREFGNVLLVKEVTRGQWTGARLERALREMRGAVHGLRRAPAFAFTCVLLLGLAIGMATTMFTVVDAVLLRPLPVRDADRVILPRTLDPNGVDVGMTQAELQRLGAASRTIRDVAGVAHQGAFGVTQTDGDRVLTLRCAWVTGNFFELLGVRPALGRFFDARDEASMSAMAHVVVLSYDTWRRRFGADSGVIGRRLGNPYTHDQATVIGVAPAGLAFPAGVESWAPQVYPILDAVVRLAPGASPEAARDEFFSVMQEIDRDRVAHGTQGAPIVRADVRTLPQAVLAGVRPRLLVLAAAVAALLLIACLNVGNLVLLRATGRETEMAVRRALGAGSAQIVRPLLWESLALALAGGLLGLATARGLLLMLPRLAPPDLPRLDVLRLSPLPLLAATLATLVALLLAGLVPTLTAARRELAAPLRLDARGGRSGRSRRRWREWLVSSQVALALVLLACSALLARSMERLARVPLGYRADHLSILTLARPVNFDSVDAQMASLYERAEPLIRAVPGVESITPIAADPFYGPQVFTSRWAPAGESDAEARANPLIPFEVGGPEYFRTFDIPLLRGRGFLATDGPDAPPVVIVSRAVAERFWPGQDPVGKQLRLVGDTSAGAWHTVVGEAGDIRYRAIRQATPTVYAPWHQLFFQGVIAIRTTTTLDAVLPGLRQAVRAAVPGGTIARADAMDDLLAGQLALPRLSALLVSGFGLTALLLVAVGLYGVMAAAVRERTHELGIRAALGATPARLRRDVLGRAGVITAAGGATGLVTALATTRFLRALLYGVGPTDPAALLAACGLLLTVALLAAYVPAWRATRADPARALRAE
jgi:putative ABC transport system permease protein